MGNTGEVFPVQTLLNHWTEDQDMMWARQLVTLVKKKNGKLTMERFPPDCHAADDVQVVLKSALTVGGPGHPYQVRPAVRSCPWPSSP